MLPDQILNRCHKKVIRDEKLIKSISSRILRQSKNVVRDDLLSFLTGEKREGKSGTLPEFSQDCSTGFVSAKIVASNNAMR